MRTIPIWGAVIPGNSHEEKITVMEIEKRKKPRLIHYGTKDMLIPPAVIEEYVQCAKDHGCDITTLALEGANHGYGADPKGKKTIQWIEAYADWLKMTDQ